ncbi:PAS domain Sbox domain containing protein [Acanthamoeba castellanii str. Neff]|uniref:PAS domain Sbox domain containing protein n=1 Tax=Acanthamoeba castellanii (strain ATCC 30010 / Neff) TaxID=1257118 RepID=L8GTK3_ACACF|nr:PAS domain Sbox domain containing protein [Acanthamoeba castellanii str. Neff]ELR16340.1 PAS domain Sbox domain containing protein [Acanthamoeba castellanii str. Neff]
MKKIKGKDNARDGKEKDVAGDNGSTAELARLQAKDPTTWTVSEVGKWLDFIELGQYKLIFIENSISGAELFELEAEDLASINVRQLGHRKRILKRIAQLKKNSKAAFQARSEDGSSDSSSGDGASSSNDPSSRASSSKTGRGASSTASSASDEQMLKCFYGEDVTVLRVKRDITFTKLNSKLKAEYKKDMEVAYKDSDGDVIPITKSAHLKAAMKEADGRAVRLQLKPRDTVGVDGAINASEILLLDNFVDGCILINRRGVITFFSAAAEKLWGYTRREVLGKPIKILMPEQVGRQHDEYLKNYLASGEPKILGKPRMVIAERKDKSTFPIFLSVSELKVDKGKERVFIGTAKDMSSVKAASQSSVSDGAIDFSILDNILDVGIVINEKGLIHFFNKKAEEFFQWKRTEIIGRNVKMLMPSPFSDEHDRYLSNYMSTGEAKIIGLGRDVIAQKKDGSIAPVHLGVTEQGLEGNKFFTGILRPIVEEKKSDKTILQEEREVIDNLLIPAIIIDEKATIHGFNKTASELLGFSLIEVVGKNVKMLMPNPDKQRHDGYISSYLRTGKAKVLGTGRDVVALHKDGTMLPVRLSVTERRDGEKRIFTGVLQKL